MAPNDFLLGEINQKVDQLLDIAKDHEPRIRGLETWKTRALGYMAGASMVGGGVIAVALHFIR